MTASRTRIVAAAALVALVCGGERSVAAAGRPVVFQSVDGTPLAGTIFEASNRPAPGVVLVHMLGRSKDDWTRFAERLQDEGLTALAIDLRGHGSSGGDRSSLPAMVGDVRAAVQWLAARPSIRPGALAIAGASLGASLAALASPDNAAVRAVAMLSPSLDYRGVRIDAGLMKRLGDRPVWLAASIEDPYALRTVKELIVEGARHEQHLARARAHGTNLLASEPDLARSLLDWLERTLIF
jgi:alpha-beta hydrolase superfamily lysophospholipase